MLFKFNPCIYVISAERVSRLARLAKKEFPGIDEADYVPPGAKKKKKVGKVYAYKFYSIQI